MTSDPLSNHFPVMQYLILSSHLVVSLLCTSAPIYLSLVPTVEVLFLFPFFPFLQKDPSSLKCLPPIPQSYHHIPIPTFPSLSPYYTKRRRDQSREPWKLRDGSCVSIAMVEVSYSSGAW